MKCERYWREGVLLVEQGKPDPHRETCLDCRREHEARAELVRAFALVGGEHPGDPQWQARVWRRIAREGRPRSRLWWVWVGAPAAAMGVALALLVMLPGGREPEPRAMVAAAAAAQRSVGLGPQVGVVRSTDAATLGRWIEVAALAGDQVWFYRRGVLEFRCSAAVAAAIGPGSAGATERCVRDVDALRAGFQIRKPGEHHVLLVADPELPSSGTFDADYAEAMSSGRLRMSQPYDVQ